MATDNLMPQSSTSIIKHFMLRSSSTGQGLTGKVASDFTGKYNIAGGVEVTLSFSAGTAGDAYSSGKIVPLGLGKYAWHVPNAVFASLGNVSAVLAVTGGIDVHCEWLVVVDNRELATKPVNVTQFGGTAGTFASGIPTVALDSASVNAVADQVWDEATSGHTTAGTYGGRIVRATNTNVEVQITGSNHIAADVHELQAGVITAGDFAANSITASALATDAVTEIQSGLASQSSVDTLTSYVDTEIAAIKAKTDNLPSDPADQSLVEAAITAATSPLATPAQVNAQVLDVLTTDTFAELSAPPAATSSLKDKITWLFMYARNKVTQTALARTLYRDDTTTVAGTSATSDNGTTFTKGEDA